MGASPAFARVIAQPVNSEAAWSAMPQDVRGILLSLVADAPEVTHVCRMPRTWGIPRWSEMTSEEQQLIGALVRAFGRACRGDALRLGLLS